MNQSNYRFFLLLAFKTLVIIGLFFVLTPFITSVFDEDMPLKSTNNKIVTVNLVDLNPGEFIKLTVGYTPVWIYRRDKKQIQQITKLSALMADPLSKLNIQPNHSRNLYRSFDPRYFVFIPMESQRSCNIRFLDEPNVKLETKLTQKKLNWLGGFTESCYGSIYDLSGRRYRETGKKAQKNLSVPEYSILNNSKQQGDVIQFKIDSLAINK